MDEKLIIPTNCKFCENKAYYGKPHRCNFVLSAISENKTRALNELLTHIKLLDWSSDRTATLEVIQIESELHELDIWYRIFP
jgi:hypothetical protein